MNITFEEFLNCITCGLCGLNENNSETDNKHIEILYTFPISSECSILNENNSIISNENEDNITEYKDCVSDDEELDIHVEFWSEDGDSWEIIQDFTQN